MLFFGAMTYPAIFALPTLCYYCYVTKITNNLIGSKVIVMPVNRHRCCNEEIDLHLYNHKCSNNVSVTVKGSCISSSLDPICNHQTCRRLWRWINLLSNKESNNSNKRRQAIKDYDDYNKRCR